MFSIPRFTGNGTYESALKKLFALRGNKESTEVILIRPCRLKKKKKKNNNRNDPCETGGIPRGRHTEIFRPSEETFTKNT